MCGYQGESVRFSPVFKDIAVWHIVHTYLYPLICLFDIILNTVLYQTEYEIDQDLHEVVKGLKELKV